MSTNYLAGLINPLEQISAGRKYVQEGDDYSRKLMEYANQQQAGAQYASGDLRGAAQTTARGGNIPGAAAIQSTEAAQLKAQHDYLRQFAPLLDAAYQKDGAPGAARAWQLVAPELQAAGASQAEIDRISQGMQTNPQGTVEMIKALAQREFTFNEAGAWDKATGQLVTPAPQKPQRPIVVPHDADLVGFGQNGAQEIPIQQTSGAAASSPAPAGGMAAPVATPTPQPSAPAPSPTNRPMPVAPTNQHAPLPAPGPSDAYLAPHRPEGNMAQATPEGAPAQATPGGGARIIARGRTSPPKPDAPTIDPQTLDYLATRFRMGDTSVLTGLGRSGAGKLAVLQRAQEQATALGGTPEGDAAAASLRKASDAALRQQTQIAATVSQAERTALYNADMVLNLAPKAVGPSGLPALDWLLQKGRVSSGNPKVAAYDAAITTFTNEYARVMSGGTGNQQLQNSARDEAAHMLNDAHTIEQVRAIIGLMKRDMANRTQAIQDERAALTAAVSQSPQGSRSSQPTSPTNQPAKPAPAKPMTDEELLRHYGVH